MCGILALLMKKNQSLKYSQRFMQNQLSKINWRGPDAQADFYPDKNVWFGFKRLSINDLSTTGMQPMKVGPITVIANCEIYNYKDLKKQYGIDFHSTCDTEIIPQLYLKFGIEKTVKLLDGVFAFVLHDSRTDQVWAARDPFGVRPIFIGSDDNGNIALASEAKALREFCSSIQHFPPSHYWNYDKQEYTKYFKIHNNEKTLAEMGQDYDLQENLDTVKQNFLNGVQKRLLSDREIGCFLSGGLDSSLVTGLVSQTRKSFSLNTFSIGMDGNSPDLKYAQKVAEYCKTTHHHVEFTVEDALEHIHDLIYTLESYDVTTIRASLGMYLLSKHVKTKTDVTVLFSGEGADEVAQGYLYFHKQPTPLAGAQESLRLVNDLHMYDILRCDRTTSGWGLEVREPFLDKQFVQSYFGLPTDVRCPQKIEKFTLRNLFKDDKVIPDEVLWRIKEAFSDGMAAQKKTLHLHIKEYVEGIITDTEFERERKLYKVQPISKEALFYRRIYDNYFGKWDFIPYYWVPRWTDSENPDPSAREQNFYKHSDEALEKKQQEQSQEQEKPVSAQQ